MSVLICGFALFSAAFLFHAVAWRVKKPANTVKALELIFCLVLTVGVIMLIQFGRIYPHSLMLPHDFISYSYIVVLFFSLFLVYLLSYPAIEADSPSLAIVLHISRAEDNGITAEEIKELLKDNQLVEPRLRDLVDAKIVDLTGSVYRINKKGMFFIQPFIAYRKFLKLGKGG